MKSNVIFKEFIGEFKITFGYMEPGKPWQVVYKTHEGKDYCRETYAACLSQDGVKMLAVGGCSTHNLAGAHIERWGNAS